MDAICPAAISAICTMPLSWCITYDKVRILYDKSRYLFIEAVKFINAWKRSIHLRDFNACGNFRQQFIIYYETNDC